MGVKNILIYQSDHLNASIVATGTVLKKVSIAICFCIVVLHTCAPNVTTKLATNITCALINCALTPRNDRLLAINATRLSKGTTI